MQPTDTLDVVDQVALQLLCARYAIEGYNKGHISYVYRVAEEFMTAARKRRTSIAELHQKKHHAKG